MNMKKSIETIGAIIIAAAFGAVLKSAVQKAPTIEEISDLTGDGIQDVILDDSQGKWLFVGKPGGGYERAQYKHRMNEFFERGSSVKFESGASLKYFKTDEGKIYVFNGQYYMLLPQQKK